MPLGDVLRHNCYGTVASLFPHRFFALERPIFHNNLVKMLSHMMHDVVFRHGTENSAEVPLLTP